MLRVARTNAADRFKVRVARFHELSPEILSAWERLEERALEGNAYLSRHFVVPAMRHLSLPEETRDALFVFVEKRGGVAEGLAGAGVFVRSNGTRRFPLPHLRAYASPHSYLSGILADRDEAEGAVRAFFRFFCGKGAPWYGVEFENLSSEGRQAVKVAEAAGESGAVWMEHAASRRAVFHPAEGGEEYIRRNFSPHRMKILRQALRRLEEKGGVSWKAFRGTEVADPVVERFLAVEHAGWKADGGTSLRSRPAHEAFFREMVCGFRKTGNLFFTELSLDGLPVALTSNLVSGGAGFAFKIGAHRDYARFSPGALNETEFIRRAPRLFGDLEFVDSGAEDGSFIEQYWTRRRALSSGIFGTTPVGRKVLSGVRLLRRVKRMAKIPEGESRE